MTWKMQMNSIACWIFEFNEKKNKIQAATLIHSLTRTHTSSPYVHANANHKILLFLLIAKNTIYINQFENLLLLLLLFATAVASATAHISHNAITSKQICACVYCCVWMWMCMLIFFVNWIFMKTDELI